MIATKNLKPPENVTGAAKQWWRAMVDVYAIEDEPHAVELLGLAAMQLVRLEQYRECLADVGPTVRDRFGQLRENPAAVGERAASNAFRLLVRELGIMPTEADSRPPRTGGR